MHVCACVGGHVHANECAHKWKKWLKKKKLSKSGIQWPFPPKLNMMHVAKRNTITIWRFSEIQFCLGFAFLLEICLIPKKKTKQKKITLKFQGENTISSDKQKRNPDKTHVNTYMQCTPTCTHTVMQYSHKTSVCSNTKHQTVNVNRQNPQVRFKSPIWHPNSIWKGRWVMRVLRAGPYFRVPGQRGRECQSSCPSPWRLK